MNPFFVRVLVFVVAVGALVVLAMKLFPRGPRFKCATCRHCGRLDRDGVMCRFGTKEVFKNAIHIENCMDHDFAPDSR